MHAVLEEVGERLLLGDESLIRIPEICEATGVNYGSVYHHFGSREGVIDAAYNMLFSKYALEDIKMLRIVSESASTREEYVGNLTGLAGSFSFRPDRVNRRSVRVRIVAASLTRPNLKVLIGATQKEVTEELQRIIQDGQDRGWLRRDVTAHSVAVALQSILVGRIIDDVSDQPIDVAEWQPLMSAFLGSLFMS
jgi:AcrR family transcriptional regulator